ncbi:MAG: NnrS family protein [Vicinamibacterales bacterium]|nr:NnrS family protein [Vicinamibacterales bacterium]
MAVIPIEPPPSRHAQSAGIAVLALGFRPFFLLAGVSAVLLVGVWPAVWGGRLAASPYYGTIGWHSHEMLFGYTVAVVAGFLLTAVRNWTGLRTPDGPALAGLALLWLAPRVAAFLPVPHWLVALVDVAFLPALTAALYPALMGAKSPGNRFFLPLVGAMALANVLVHADLLGHLPGAALRGTALMVDLVLLLVLIVSGRVIAFFTERGIEGARPVSRRWVEVSGIVGVVMLAMIDLGGRPALLEAIVCAALAVVTLVRLVGWHDPRVWRTPLLWVLHLAVLWLAVGFALRALGAFGLAPPMVALHGLTVGAIGVLTLGMMSRVTLGHTGRMLQPPMTATIAFGVLNLAAIVRVLFPLVAPERYLTWVHASAGLWTLAFLLFLVAHGLMLWRPRVDGRHG